MNGYFSPQGQPPTTGGVRMDDWRPTAADRCDGLECGAQAWVSTTINGTDMLWCASHYRRGEAKLVEVATRIRDFRFMLDMP